MNTLHLKYAVEVEKAGSISKAAENLYMNQPHLSKAIRELENSIGISIFNRTSKGVIPTKKGIEFLFYAKNILSQIEEMEALYKPGGEAKLKFDIAVPRASYISLAFTEFLKAIDLDDEIDIDYRETNSLRAIKNVSASENNLGIVRYQSIYEKYFMNIIEEKDLKYQPIWEYECLVLLSVNHPLASKENIDYDELGKYIKITHGDLSIPSLPISKIKEIKKTNEKKKEISVYERASQFEILKTIPDTYMWVSPMPDDVLKCFSLTQKRCNASKNKYKDILIFRKGYKFSKEDKLFIKKLHNSINEVASK